MHCGERPAVADGQQQHLTELNGQVLLIVGYGSIGHEVAKRAKAFDMRVLAWDPYVPDAAFTEAGVERVQELADLFRRSDYVSAHLPLNAGTRATETLISRSGSRVKLMVIPTNEELVVARETKRFLEHSRN